MTKFQELAAFLGSGTVGDLGTVTSVPVAVITADGNPLKAQPKRSLQFIRPKTWRGRRLTRWKKAKKDVKAFTL